MKNIEKQLDKAIAKFWDNAERVPTNSELAFYRDRIGGFSAVMPIEHEEYWSEVLDNLKPDDVLCDMGAAFGRMALQATQRCKKVYMVDLCPELVQIFLKVVNFDIPRNLVVICADWNNISVSDDVTVISCLVNISKEDLPQNWWQEGRRVLLHIKSQDDL
jgi:predicted RNA methylase